MVESFESIAGYFERSRNALEVENPGFETDVQRVHKLLPTAFIHRHGKQVSACAIRLNRGRGFSERITCSSDASRSDGNSYNEHLSIKADPRGPFRRSMGMTSPGPGWRDTERLCRSEAAELLCEILVSRLR